MECLQKCVQHPPSAEVLSQSYWLPANYQDNVSEVAGEMMCAKPCVSFEASHRLLDLVVIWSESLLDWG